MVLNAKDDHPSKAIPIAGRATNTLPRTAMQAIAHFLFSSFVGREKSKQPMAHTGVQSDEVHSWISLI